MTPDTAKAILDTTSRVRPNAPGHSDAELAAFARRLTELRQREFQFRLRGR